MKRLYVLLFISFCCVILSYAQDAYFVSDNIAKDKNKSADAIPWHQKDKGWWCAIEVHAGSVWYKPKTYEGMVGFTLVNGYRFSQFAKLGIGIGFNGVLYDYKYTSQFPYKLMIGSLRLILNARGNIIRQDSRRCVPFWNADIGCDVFHELFFFDAGVGVRVGLDKKNFNRHAFVLSANYIGRMVDEHYSVESDFSNGIMFKVGYEF
ncbi:MAG: hypothetical protein J6X01_05860 [Bacteroidales bacterium]|nr:hypothetical protein [Bacteroidales bacterium]